MGSSLTVQGALTILVRIDNDGTIAVDGEGDTMYIGATGVAAPTQLSVCGDGVFEVSSGNSLYFRKAKLDSGGSQALLLDLDGGLIHIVDATFTPAQGTIDWDFDISGGTLEIERDLDTTGDVDISGGTLQFEADFDSTGNISFTNGTITVVEDKVVSFDPS